MKTFGEGTLFAGHRVGAVIGQGGMAVVYRATHLGLDREVALKVISPALATDQAFRERFKRESRMAASLHHPNIVTIHDAGEEDGSLYITMELVDSDLSKTIRESGRMSPDEAVGVLAQVGSALDAAHEQDLVHRDVKPANILTSNRFGGHRFLLSDFGLTRRVSSVGGITKTGQWVGTLDYVSPEQVKGQEVDRRADVYSLGCVLFEMLTGEVPFPVETDIAKMWAQVNEDPPDPLEGAPGIGSSLAGVVSRALEKEPSDRYETCGALVQAAIESLDGLGEREVEEPSESIAGEVVVETIESDERATVAHPPPSRIDDVEEPVPEEDEAEGREGGSEDGEGPSRASYGLDSGVPEWSEGGQIPTRIPPRPPTRATATSPELAERIRLRRRKWALAVAGILAVTVGTGAILLTQGADPVRAATSGAVEVEFDDGWSEVAAGEGFDGLEFEADPVALRSDDARGSEGSPTAVRAGRVMNARGAPDPLPASLRERFPQGFRRDLVEVSGAPWFRYQSLPGGTETTRLTLLLVATDKGYQGLACEVPRNRAAAPEDGCAQIASTLSLVGASAYPLGPDERFAGFLAKTLSGLEAAEKKAEKGLRANSVKRQAAAARTLASAYRKAASSLDKFEALPQDRIARSQMLRALRDLADAYSKLAAAAAAGDSSAFDRARDGVRRGVEKFLLARDGLTRNGYRFKSPPRVSGASGKK